MFDELKVRPENTFDTGLFWRDKRTERLRRLHAAAGRVRTATGNTPILSDDALGLDWALIGVGVDPTAYIRADQSQRWQRAGGKVWQWCQRSQAQHLAAAHQRLEALDETLLPHRAARLGGHRPSGPLRHGRRTDQQVETMLEQALGGIKPVALAAFAPDRLGAH